MADHSSFARIKKIPALFGNGVMLLDHSATMACNVQRERSRKMALIMVVYFIPVRKIKMIRAAILSGEIKKEDEDPFEPFSTVYFSNPPSYGYTVKETGENFTSRHENRIEAYKEYLSLKTKKENL